MNNHIKNIRYLVGYLGFLSLGLYMLLASFGQFKVSEPVTMTDSTGTCGGLVYLGFVCLSLWNSNNLVTRKPSDEKEVAPWGIIIYILFLAVEYLVFGSAMRGVIHAILPMLALMLPSTISLITKKE